MNFRKLPPTAFSRTLALVPSLVALATLQVDADIFIRIEPSSGPAVLGEVTEKNHEGWIEASSASFGISATTTIGSGGVSGGKAAASDLLISKLLDRSSPPLFLACAKGTKYNKVTLEFTRPTDSGAQICYYRIILRNVLVSSLTTSAGTDRPSESVSFTYETIAADYFQADPKTGAIPTNATTTGSWDFIGNKAL